MGSKLYVGNLNYNTTEDTLREIFSADGRTVNDIFLAVDRVTGRPRGFAFVEMSTEEEATACIESCDGREVDGRPIRVSEAKERSEGRGGNGGGGRRGSFGGGGGFGGGGFGERGGRGGNGGGGRRGGGFGERGQRR